MLLLNRQPQWKSVAHLAVTCYGLQPASLEQGTLFETDRERRRKLSEASDRINDKYGEFLITPALMMGMRDTILDRISFGSVADVRDVYGD